MSLGYKFVLQDSAFRFAIRRGGAERDRLSAFFKALAADPYKEGNFQETDADGRRLEVALHGKFLVSYWTDHAVKEVRIARIDLVEHRRYI